MLAGLSPPTLHGVRDGLTRSVSSSYGEHPHAVVIQPSVLDQPRGTYEGDTITVFTKLREEIRVR